MQRPRLTVPTAMIAAAVVALPLLASVAMAADPTVTVRPGDTLTAISRRSGVSIERLVQLNDLRDPNRIFAGQRLRVAAPTAAAPAPSADTPQLVHVVRRGESLWGIARHYDVSLRAVVAANALADPGRIFAGQRIVIPPAEAPEAQPAPAPADTPQLVHVVRRGESLWGIARHYDVSLRAVVAANALADPGRIFAGQRIVIPGAEAPVSAPPARAALPASLAGPMGEREAVRRVIVEEADRYGVPRALALAVAWQESGWRQGVVSPAGAIGVMQLLPATADWVGETMLATAVDPNATRDNVRAGVRLLAHYLDRYGGDRAMALAAYYQGQRAADRHGIYTVTRPYIASILALERLLGG